MTSLPLLRCTVLRWLGVAAVALSLGLAGPTLAAKKPTKPSKKPGWVVLVHLSGEVPSSWTERLRLAAQKAQDRNWVDPPAVTLDEVQLVLGCAAWDNPCAAQVAGMSGAVNALVVDVTRNGAGASLRVQAVTAEGVVAAEHDKIELAAVDDDGLKIAEAWVAGAVKGATPTVLVVSSDLEGTEVVVDNIPRGKTPLTLIDQIPVGEHALLMRREGRAPLSRTIQVVAGMNREHGVLSAGGPAMKSDPVVGTVKTLPPETASTPPPAGEIPPLALVGWGMTGVGGLTAVVTGVLGALWQVDVNDFNGNIDENDRVKNEYQRTFGGPVTGGERGAFFQSTFGTPGDDTDALNAGVNAKQTLAVTMFVVTGIGALIAGTGAGLALSAGGEAADDAALAPVVPASR
ncbi:MAG: PEGA domain-containing protein [Deltaproteobacteria bacterium]|nr:PEGA domain-containing protein [Deltaproteobacteria bacterium]